MLKPAFALLLVVASGGARAEVVSAAAGGFAVSETVTIKASPKQVYAALGKIGQWWNAQHTVTGDAKNLHLDLGIKGCFCEKSPDGRERIHMAVVDIQPNTQVRLRGALGPLQGQGVDGALTWTIKPAEGGVSFTQGYNVGGYMADGLDKIAPIVDQVLHDQLTRFKSFVETGSPETETK